MEEVLLYVITSPVGPYYPTGFEPCKLVCETNYVRAFKGGMGDSKIGGKYVGAYKLSRLATETEYSQVLWLLNGKITEVGAMNISFVFDKGSDKKEVVTPPLRRRIYCPE